MVLGDSVGHCVVNHNVEKQYSFKKVKLYYFIMAGEVIVDALPYIDQGYDEPGVREAVS